MALFRHLARAREEGEVREMPGVLIACCGAMFHMFNAAFLADPVDDEPGKLERRVAIAAVHFGARGLRWAFWVNEDKLTGGLAKRAQTVFHDHGLGLAARMPAMVTTRLTPPLRPPPALDVRPIEDGPGRLAFCHILSVSFCIPFGWCQELYGPEGTWTGDLGGYVGYAGGEPVTVAAMMIAADAAGLYCVGTLPGHQRKGYAEAIMRHALEDARSRRGIERSVLQSTATGLPLYQRLGYETVTRFAVYSS